MRDKLRVLLVGLTSFCAIAVSGPLVCANDPMRPVTSAVHVLPPVGASTQGNDDFDSTLTDFITITVSEIGESSEIVFLPRVKLQKHHYHVHWNVGKDAVGKVHEIQLLVAELGVGAIAYTPSAPRTIPIKFRIENHPQIRTRVLFAQGYSASALAETLKREFDLSASDTMRMLGLEDYSAIAITEALSASFGIGAAEAASLVADHGHFSAIEVAEALMQVFGLGADPFAIAEMLRDAGYTGSEIYNVLKALFDFTVSDARQLLELLGFSESEVFDATIIELAEKFAPQLRFDVDAYNFPMSAQEYYEDVIVTGRWTDPAWHEVDLWPFWYGAPQKDNQDPITVTENTAPTYFKALTCGDQVRIMYWWFYGWQSECLDLGVARFGEHNGDWEKVMVTLSEDASKIAAVTFWQHKGQYTRIVADTDWHACPPWENCGVDMHFDDEENPHPAVYVGKTQHGSYHDEGGLGGCGYQYDFRNNDNENLRLDTWENLINLTEMGEPWMQADAQADAQPFSWGWDGVSTHPTTYPEFGCLMTSCAGRDEWAPLETNGCYLSQCEVGDRYAWPSCYHCPPGHTDWGLICVNNCWAYPFCHSHSIETYGIDYTISTTDVGLISKAD